MTRRSRFIGLVAAAAALATPGSASAATQMFHRFEAVATANYRVLVPCPDGPAVQQRVTVIGGHEEESDDGPSPLDHDFLTVLLRGVDCDGELVNDRVVGDGAFSFSPSLQRAGVTGALTTGHGRTVVVDMAWDGAGPLETTSNVTKFDGFVGHFLGRRRDAVGTGTAVVDGATLVDGSTSDA